MAANDNNGKRKVEEEAECSAAVRKRLQLSDDDGDDYSSESEEVSLEESSMNHLDTSEEKLMTKCGHGLFFDDDGDNLLTESEPRSLGTPSCCVRSDPNDDFWCQVARATCSHSSKNLLISDSSLLL
jgi:hypothetical protein